MVHAAVPPGPSGSGVPSSPSGTAGPSNRVRTVSTEQSRSPGLPMWWSLRVLSTMATLRPSRRNRLATASASRRANTADPSAPDLARSPAMPSTSAASPPTARPHVFPIQRNTASGFRSRSLARSATMAARSSPWLVHSASGIHLTTCAMIDSLIDWGSEPHREMSVTSSRRCAASIGVGTLGKGAAPSPARSSQVPPLSDVRCCSDSRLQIRWGNPSSVRIRPRPLETKTPDSPESGVFVF